MSADVHSAWIAAGASLAVSILSLGSAIWAGLNSNRTQREQAANAKLLERLKGHIDDLNDAAKAKRDYEYEARKRLYTELYPLAYQLHQVALQALHRIANLAMAARSGHLAAGPDNWLVGGDPYYFTSTIHRLIAPLAVYELMTRKLTLLDLSLDPDLHYLHFVAGRAHEALRSDFNLVDPRYPPIKFGPADERYSPPEDRPTIALPDLEQRWKWRQALYSGQINQAIHAVLTSEGGRDRVMTYAEFANALEGADLRSDTVPPGNPGKMKKILQPIVEIFRDFHPARRPVTWRIMLAQCACYRMISGPAIADPESQETSLSRPSTDGDRQAFDWVGDELQSIPPALRGGIDFRAEQSASWKAAQLFVQYGRREWKSAQDHRFSASP
jgi:hypothetical protein